MIKVAYTQWQKYDLKSVTVTFFVTIVTLQGVFLLRNKTVLIRLLVESSKLFQNRLQSRIKIRFCNVSESILKYLVQNWYFVTLYFMFNFKGFQKVVSFPLLNQKCVTVYL